MSSTEGLYKYGMAAWAVTWYEWARDWGRRVPGFNSGGNPIFQGSISNEKNVWVNYPITA